MSNQTDDTPNNIKLPVGTLSFIDKASDITINEVVNQQNPDSRVLLVSREMLEDIETEAFFEQVFLLPGVFGDDKKTEISEALNMFAQFKPDIIIFNEPLLGDVVCSEAVLRVLSLDGVNLITTDNPADIVKLSCHLDEAQREVFDAESYMGKVYSS